MRRKPSDLTVTDLFCGAGGSSIGAAEAGGRLRMALNHWDLAIETHNSNFPDADHDCTDASACDPRRYPSTQILLASPECTSHSLAKGKRTNARGQGDFFVPTAQAPEDVRSRATMWDVPRFAEAHRYEIVVVENVVDAKRWDPFPAWIQAMHCLGYRHREVFLNSMFAHPTPQSRDRMYVVFWRKGNREPDLTIEPPAWCSACEVDVEAVQGWKAGRTWGRYGQQYVYLCPRCAGEVEPYYFAALNAIDFALPAERIGDRKRPLKPRTLERIRFGLEKYGRDPLLVVTNMTTDAGRVRSALAEAGFTQTGSPTVALVHGAPWLAAAGSREVAPRGAEDPLPTQTGSERMGVAFPPGFVVHLRGTAEDQLRGARSLMDVLGTVSAGGGHHGLVLNGAAMVTLRDHPRFVFNQLNEAMPTQVAAGPQTAIITRAPFLATYMGKSQAHPVDGPLPTVVGKDREALVQPDETPAVEDCHFRMLQPHEIQAGMAFPKEYTVLGTKTERTKLLGNAVTPPVMRELMRRCVESLEVSHGR